MNVSEIFHAFYVSNEVNCLFLEKQRFVKVEELKNYSAPGRVKCKDKIPSSYAECLQTAYYQILQSSSLMFTQTHYIL
jgi:hypothetical protein